MFCISGVRLGHISRVQLGPLRSFMSYIQEAHPARLKKIYICHAASFVNQVMSLVKPLIKSELMTLLHFTTKGPQTLFEKHLLPLVSSCFELPPCNVIQGLYGCPAPLMASNSFAFESQLLTKSQRSQITPSLRVSWDVWVR